MPRVAVPAGLTAFASQEPLERARHTWGKSYLDRVRGFRGDFSAAPDVVARPRSEDELNRVLEACDAQRLACVPFGGGTSVVGGVEALTGILMCGWSTGFFFAVVSRINERPAPPLADPPSGAAPASCPRT